jgi:hypothetical protein
MPAEPKYGLPARTTMAGTLRIGRFAKRRWRRPKTDQRPRFLNSASPHPSFRRTAAGSKRAGEFIGPDRVVAPIGIDGPPRRCREERPAERMYQDGYWKDFRQIAHEARPRLFISLNSPRGYSHGSTTLACYRNGTMQAKRCESVAGPRWADRKRHIAANGSTFSSVFAEATLGLKCIFFEAENALSAATATGQWAQPDCYGLDVVAALFFPLFLLGRSRNLHERGSRRGDLRLLLFRLFGFPVAPNLTFRHRNSPLRRLAGCEHSIVRSAVVSVKSRPIGSNRWG